MVSAGLGGRALARAIAETGADREKLAEIALKVHDQADIAAVTEGATPVEDASTEAFEAVAQAVGPSPAPAAQKPVRQPASRPLTLGGRKAGSVKRTARGLTLNIDDRGFADWLDAQAPQIIQELHARWTSEAED